MKEKVTFSLEKTTNERLREMAKGTSKNKSQIIDILVRDTYFWYLCGKLAEIDGLEKRLKKSSKPSVNSPKK